MQRASSAGVDLALSSTRQSAVHVAVEVLIEQPGRMRAHAIPDLFADWVRFGLAHCGYPADQLGVLPDLEWGEVLPEMRCPHCADELAIRATAS